MKSKIMSIYARTPLHIGAGSSVGVVDLPIIRERHTGYPVIPGSSLKGVLADLWNDDYEQTANGKDYVRKVGSASAELFGIINDSQASSGNLLIGESQLLAFPVRSAKGAFAWLISPLSLGRYLRTIGKHFDGLAACFNAVNAGTDDNSVCYAPESLAVKGNLILEEYRIGIKGQLPAELVEELAKMSSDSLWKDELQNHLVLVSDDMFGYFVENTCEIAQHVKIDDRTGVAEDGALFNQENVPSETMFFTKVTEKKQGLITQLEDKLTSEGNVIQIGADATTGLGWCSVTVNELA